LLLEEFVLEKQDAFIAGGNYEEVNAHTNRNCDFKLCTNARS